MSDVLVSLYRILPNPWQTRHGRAGNDAHVQDLAADIGARGLLQVPLGRLVTGRDNPQPYDCPLPDSGDLATTAIEQEGCFVQLACGHNRLAAYKLLDLQAPNDVWQRMPVRIAALDDASMALAAWSENAQRKDLSPFEAALALQRLITDFGWTQDQVAAHVGLNRSTVANKLRLLRLPEELQKKLHAGDLSERQALAILPVYELPAAAQERVESKRRGGDYRLRNLDKILERPANASSEDIRTAVREAVGAATLPLCTDETNYSRAYFPVDREIVGVDAPACQSCPHCLRGKRCADPACYYRKDSAWERQEMAFALAATGLPLLTAAVQGELPGYNAVTYFYNDDDGQAGLATALEGACPHLHLRYAPGGARGTLRVPDYPDAQYCCVEEGRNNGSECACRKVHHAEAERKRTNAELFEATLRELASDLRAQDVGAWRAVKWALAINDYGAGTRDHPVKTPDLGTLCEQIARMVLKRAVQWDAVRLGQHNIAADLASWREKVGWGVVTPGNPEETTVEASDA